MEIMNVLTVLLSLFISFSLEAAASDAGLRGAYDASIHELRGLKRAKSGTTNARVESGTINGGGGESDQDQKTTGGVNNHYNTCVGGDIPSYAKGSSWPPVEHYCIMNEDCASCCCRVHGDMHYCADVANEWVAASCTGAPFPL